MGSDAGGTLHGCDPLQLLVNKQQAAHNAITARSGLWACAVSEGRVGKWGGKQAQHAWPAGAPSRLLPFAEQERARLGWWQPYALDGEFGSGASTGALLRPFGKQK